MNDLFRNGLACVAALLVALAELAVPSAAYAEDIKHDPTAILNALADRMYGLGETSGEADAMNVAEEKAADEILSYIAHGSTEGLLGDGRSKQSPLAAAAYMGYPDVVAALLTSQLVRAHLNDADERGMTPWIAATLSMRQSLWTCNPSVFADPYRVIPMFVTQPYYMLNPTPPYKKTRALLEAAGASADMKKAKDFWTANCKNESAETKAAVEASTDLQSTVQALAASDLGNMVMKMRRK